MRSNGLHVGLRQVLCLADWRNYLLLPDCGSGAGSWGPKLWHYFFTENYTTVNFRAVVGCDEKNNKCPHSGR